MKTSMCVVTFPVLLGLLAAISAEGAINLVITLLIVGLIFWLLHWLIGYVGIGEPFAKIARVILAVAAVLICINALLGLAGHPIIKW